MNPFGMIGLAVDLTGVTLLVVGVLLTGDARWPLIFTGAALSLVGAVMLLIGQRVGRFHGLSPRLAARGVPATALIEQMADTGVIFRRSPVVRFRLMVTHEARDYPAEVQQAVPRRLGEAVLPGSRLAVKVDPKQADRVVVDWSQAPIPPRAPAAGTVGWPGGRAPAGAVLPRPPESATELLARGRRGTARIMAARAMGEAVGPGVAAPDDERAGGMMTLLDLEVKLPGRDAYPVRVVDRVPASQAGSVGPGREVVVAVDRDDPEHRVAVDWEASLV